MQNTENTETTENTKYEIMVILLPDLGEENSKKELDEIRSLINENGGEIYHEDIWGIKDFAYRMKKQKQGFYAVLNFTLEPEKMKKLEKPLRLNQKLIRYLITKTPENYEIKTLKDYLTEAEKEEREQKEKDVSEKTEVKKKTKKESKKEEVKEQKTKKSEEATEEVAEEKTEAKVAEAKTEAPPAEEPEKEPKKEEKKPAVKLDDVDERLKSIIDDPDISL